MMMMMMMMMMMIIIIIIIITVSSAIFATLQQENAQNHFLDIYNNTLNIPTCFDPQGTIIRESNQSNNT